MQQPSLRVLMRLHGSGDVASGPELNFFVPFGGTLVRLSTASRRAVLPSSACLRSFRVAAFCGARPALVASVDETTRRTGAGLIRPARRLPTRYIIMVKASHETTCVYRIAWFAWPSGSRVYWRPYLYRFLLRFRDTHRSQTLFSKDDKSKTTYSK